MTCCLGIEDGPRVWLGWDAASTDENFCQGIVVEPKAWKTRNGWGFAHAGSWRIGQLLRHTLDPPKVSAARVECHVQTRLVAELRAICREEEESAIKEVELLAAHRGQIYVLLGSTGWQATRGREGYAAIGAHEAYACLRLTRNWRDHERRMRTVLDAVASHAANVRPPFDVLRVGR